MATDNQLILVLIALILPPVAVYVKRDACDGVVCVNILLTFLCFGIGGGESA